MQRASWIVSAGRSISDCGRSCWHHFGIDWAVPKVRSGQRPCRVTSRGRLGTALGTAYEQTGCSLAASLGRPTSEIHRPGGEGNDSDDQNRQRQGIIVRPKAAPQMHDFASRMLRNANVRRPLLFLSIEDRQARHRWLFSRPLVAPGGERVHGHHRVHRDGGGARSHFGP
jgi:hypothetical protein